MDPYQTYDQQMDSDQTFFNNKDSKKKNTRLYRIGQIMILNIVKRKNCLVSRERENTLLYVQEVLTNFIYKLTI